MTQPLVKICGTTSPDDARLAQSAGADLIGIMVEYQPSPRSVSIERAQDIARATKVQVVALCVNKSYDELIQVQETLYPHALQLHGDETPELVAALKAEGLTIWTACHTPERAQAMHEVGADALLFDARVQSATGTVYGGTGQRSDWLLARAWVERGARVILAGGLNPENVTEAIHTVQPWAVDVVSGVEARKGVKDSAKVRAFVNAAKADSTLQSIVPTRP